MIGEKVKVDWDFLDRSPPAGVTYRSLIKNPDVHVTPYEHFAVVELQLKPESSVAYYVGN